MVLESLFNKIRGIEEEESRLDKEEKKEDQKIRELKRKVSNGSATAEDFREAINYLLEEAEESEKIAEAIFDSETDLIEIDQKVESGQFNAQISENIQELVKANEEEEKVVEHFIEEVNHLQEELNGVKSLFSQFERKGENPELERKLSNSENIINDIESKLERLKEGEEQIEMSRRKILKTGAATGAALLGLGSIGNSRRKAVGSPPQNQEMPQNSQAASTVRRENIYESKTERWSKEKQLEYLRKKESIDWENGNKVSNLEGLELQGEVKNPRQFGEKWDAPYLDDAAIEFKVKNNSQQTYHIHLVTVIPNGWAYYGMINVGSAGGGMVATEFILEPGETSEQVTFVYQSQDRGADRTVELIADYGIEGTDKYTEKNGEIQLPNFRN